MDTPYENLDEATRQEWRDNPTTAAFLATLQALLDQQARIALDTLANGGFRTSNGAEEGGRIFAFRLALDIAGRKGKAGDE